MTHPFVQAGYIAPYTYIGAQECVHRAGDELRPAGTCDVCGTCYRYGARFRDANGVAFSTGCDCASKSLRDIDPKLAQQAKLAKRDIMRENRKAQRQAAREKAAAEREEREAADKILIVSDYEQNRATLAKIGHPLDWAREKGLSWADSIDWLIQNNKHRDIASSIQKGLNLIQQNKAPKLLRVPQPSDSKHVGAIKERVQIAGQLRSVTSFDGRYGATHIVKIVTDQGDLIAVRTSSLRAFRSNNGDLEIGQAVAFSGTVKSHNRDEYANGANVTWLTRCKCT